MMPTDIATMVTSSLFGVVWQAQAAAGTSVVPEAMSSGAPHRALLLVLI